MATGYAVIPNYITVHLGRPDVSAENVTVPFTDYIKNVASSEIYPTWNSNAIKANVYAQISLALNRIYTEYYPSRGYNFDITNSTSFDQYFVKGRDIFANISNIVDNIFDKYIVRKGTVEPVFASYCDGKNTSCEGMSQWGSLSLAKQGLTPIQILRKYYGDEIEIVSGKIGNPIKSYTGALYRLGSAGEEVREIQKELNRIRKNYPLIPKIPTENGIFDKSTQNAVRQFQEIFNLGVDGIVGKQTWYAVKRLYYAVKRTNELFSEGITVSEAQRKFPQVLKLNDTCIGVKTMQFYLNVLSYFIEEIPPVTVDGIFGKNTENAVKAFQRYAGLTQDGIVGRGTWNAIIKEYDAIEDNLQNEFDVSKTLPAPGYTITIGSRGENVANIQNYINVIAENLSIVPSVAVDGVYGEETANAVKEIQKLYDLEQTGSIGPLTWNAIITLYKAYR